MPFTDAALLRWLMLLAIAHVAGGLALPLLVLHADFVTALLPQALRDPAMKPLLALFGPTIASWGVLLAFLVRHAMRQRQRWAADALLLAVLAWMPLDAALCWLHGYDSAIALDIVAAIALLVPALVLRQRFAATPTATDPDRLR